MADIFQEIDEELRQDKAKELWQRYGKYAIAAIVLILATVAGVTWWQQQQQAERLAMADRYAQALQSENQAAAAGALEDLAAQANGGYRTVARLQAAAMQAESGDHAAAAATYDKVAKDDAADSLYRDLATVLSVLHGAAAGQPAGELRARIEPQIEAGKPWRFTAREIAASLALAEGDIEAAKSHLSAISDDAEAPVDIRGRSAELLKAIDE